MYPVVVERFRSACGYDMKLVACSIECARRHGFEPTRMCLPDEYDVPCALCGFDPADFTPAQDGVKEEL